MKKALSYSVACRFEGMLRRVLHALAEEAYEGQNWFSSHAESLAGDASEGHRLAVYCAYGHVEWPNGRPDDPSRGCR